MNLDLTPTEEELIDSVRGRISLGAYVKQSALMRAKKAQKKQTKQEDPANQEREAAIQKVYAWFFAAWEKRFKGKYILTVDPKTKRSPDREKAIELIAMSPSDKAAAMKRIVERYFQDDFFVQHGCKLHMYSHNAYNDEAWRRKQQSALRQEKSHRTVTPTHKVSPLARSEEQRQKELAAQE